MSTLWTLLDGIVLVGVSIVTVTVVSAIFGSFAATLAMVVVTVGAASVMAEKE